MVTLSDMLTIAVDGVSMRCCLEGPATAPVLMFGNGLATSMAMWDAQASHFSGRYRVLRYDVRGHGGTAAPPPPYAMERLADDAVGLMDALGIGRVHYIGLSLGGMIAQSLAMRHPERVASLVLCDTAMRMRRGMWDERIAAVAADGVEPQVEPSIARWFSPSFAAEHADLVEALRKMIRGTSQAGYIGCSMAIRDADLGPAASGISAPTQVIVGRDDRSTPVGDAEALHRAIPGSALAIIDHAAHLPNIEQAARFNALMEQFIGGRCGTLVLRKGAQDAFSSRGGDGRIIPERR